MCCHLQLNFIDQSYYVYLPQPGQELPSREELREIPRPGRVDKGKLHRAFSTPSKKGLTFLQRRATNVEDCDSDDADERSNISIDEESMSASEMDTDTPRVSRNSSDGRKVSAI